ncbi:hypothetical protein A3E67_04700 [Candidatus Daviesbacteria bacterium RIFCSPHIGHO2_12_FULL_38_25]|nr:MAG: hypothetical protein A3E67_04700 [Candidatus Daviesbacteria bacterium RIFCSPHIGHO2_12_FULL_38_25]
MILSTIGANMVLKDSILTIEPRTPFLMIKNALEKVRVEPQKDDSLERYNKQNKDIDFSMSVVGG